MSAEKIPCYPQQPASPFTSAGSRPDAFTLVILGVTGDLAARKILPALYHLFLKGRLPEDARILGVARSDFSDDAFRKHLVEHLEGEPRSIGFPVAGPAWKL